MILRIYRCSVVAGREADFRDYAFRTSHPRLRQQPGLVAFYASRPLVGSDHRTRCMVQIWDSPDAIRAALGEAWQDTPTLPEEARVFVEWASVEHYEIADDYRAGTPATEGAP